MTNYGILDHETLITDRVRIDAYAQALRERVKPGAVVLDIGSGTGIMALLACKFGARKVYAIEPNVIIHLARKIADDNGCADRIEFIQNMSTKITLPERADVIVSDLRGVLPWFELHIPSITDARKRFLSTGGTLIPLRDLVWAAVVEAPELSNVYKLPDGLKMGAFQWIANNVWRKVRVTPQQLLTEPLCWATIDYSTIMNPDICAELSWTTEREGTGNGFVVWFDAVLTEGTGFSNTPGAPELFYAHAFFPWPKPVALTAGDSVLIELNANLIGDEYIWRWNTNVLNQSRHERIIASFKQSNFQQFPFTEGFSSPERWHKRNYSHMPALNEDGRIDRFILTLMDGQISLRDIADRVLARFPICFASWEEALAYVGNLSAKYSE